MQSNIVHLLTTCGLTEEFATVVATKHASQQDEIAQDPVAFVQDYWYANNREALELAELFYFTDSTGTFLISCQWSMVWFADDIWQSSTVEGMREAFLKLSVEPQLVAKVVSAPFNTELFSHRDAIEYASMVIGGQHKKAFPRADH